MGYARRFETLLITVTLLFFASWTREDGLAQEAVPPSSTASVSTPSSYQDANLNLPVSLDRIRTALEQPPRLDLSVADQPMFRVEVQERNRLQELMGSLDFKGGPTPAGGLYAAEQQRVMWPSTSYPLQQPYAAFSQSELLTILAENAAGKYLVGRVISALVGAERTHAQAAARAEARQAVADYCAAQPNAGADIQLCSNPVQ